MPKRRKKSFFQRLLGTVNNDGEEYYEDEEYFDSFEDESRVGIEQDETRETKPFEEERFSPYEDEAGEARNWENEETYEEDESGELAIDMYETPTHLIIQSMAAGVMPEDLDVSITRETCEISGRRNGPQGIADDDYSAQELYWGKFSRTVTLPLEIDVDQSEASESHGLLVIQLKKLNTDRETKLNIDTGR